MRMPHGGRRVTVTCHNGHTFLHTTESTPHRGLTRGQYALLVTALLGLFGLVLARQWVGHRIGSPKSAIAGQASSDR
jgi:hypothetical protein